METNGNKENRSTETTKRKGERYASDSGLAPLKLESRKQSYENFPV